MLVRFIRRYTVRSVSELVKSELPFYSNPSPLYSLLWKKAPKNIFIVCKPFKYSNDEKKLKNNLLHIITHLKEHYENLNIILENKVVKNIINTNNKNTIIYTGNSHEIVKITDLIITIGGDGTILKAVSFFSHTFVPPLLSFHSGTLGFLLPFNLISFESVFSKVYHSNAKLLKRDRLCVLKGNIKEWDLKTNDNNKPTLNNNLITSNSNDIKNKNKNKNKTYAMNEVHIHRGKSPHLAHLLIYVNNIFVTEALADGLIISTPTGSTAYSLSAGGSIAHPSVPCILLTPICPRSLSFRPLIFPLDAKIKIIVSHNIRSNGAEYSIDGEDKGLLVPGDGLLIQSANNRSVWSIVRTDSDWVTNLNEKLGFNSTFPHTDPIGSVKF